MPGPRVPGHEILDAYRSLLTNRGFQELPRRPGDFVDEFSVRIGNDTTVIEIEGIHYGMAAWLPQSKA